MSHYSVSLELNISISENAYRFLSSEGLIELLCSGANSANGKMWTKFDMLGGVVGKLRNPGAELAFKKFSSTQNRIPRRLSL